MQHEQGTETDDIRIPVDTPVSLSDESEEKRTRRKLLVLTGLNLFGWLSVISLVLTGLVIMLLVAMTIGSLVLSRQAEGNQIVFFGASVVIMIVTAICIVSFGVTWMIVELAFKMARLILVKQQSVATTMKI